MKTIIKYLIIIALFAITSTVNAQDKKEVLIIGVMHQVPNIIKNSYAPLLRIAIKYEPQAIYVETSLPDDSLSHTTLARNGGRSYKSFRNFSDSLIVSEKIFQLNLDEAYQRLDFDNVINYHAYTNDYANYNYYKDIKQYGLKGHSKPLRNEYDDLIYRLALHLNIITLFSMDFRQNDSEYHQAINNVTVGDESYRNYNKLIKKDNRARIIPSLFGRYGIYVNSPKTFQRFHSINSNAFLIAPDQAKSKVAYY